MRIKHKYLRNRLYKNKARKRAFKLQGGEFSHKWSCPWWCYGISDQFSVENQIKDHRESVEKYWVRSFLNGIDRGFHHAPKYERTFRKRWEKRAVKKEIDKMMKDIHNADEYDIPVSKKDADYHWF
jgi:hypothetical protein